MATKYVEYKGLKTTDVNCTNFTKLISESFNIIMQ